VDFNLQIPANAAFFYALCGLAASKPLEKVLRRKRSGSVQDQENGDPRRSSDSDESLEWSR
jgi:hypothetical protein